MTDSLACETNLKGCLAALQLKCTNLFMQCVAHLQSQRGEAHGYALLMDTQTQTTAGGITPLHLWLCRPVQIMSAIE